MVDNPYRIGKLKNIRIGSRARMSRLIITVIYLSENEKDYEKRIGLAWFLRFFFYYHHRMI